MTGVISQFTTNEPFGNCYGGSGIQGQELGTFRSRIRKALTEQRKLTNLLSSTIPPGSALGAKGRYAKAVDEAKSPSGVKYL